MAGDDLVLQLQDKRISGWTRVSVKRGVETCPSSFEIAATSDSPIYEDAVGVREGSPCTVLLGGDIAVTGYLDIVAPAFDNKSHEVRLVGRGKCADLVDCSAEWPSGWIGDTDIVSLATGLCGPYGIAVRLDAPPPERIPAFSLSIGETPWSVLERVARQSGLLLYETETGDLIFTRAGASTAASGFREGVNIEAASVLRSMAQRYSSYECSLTSTRSFGGVNEGSSDPFYAKVQDPNVSRNRRLAIVAEDGNGSLELVKRRAEWEAARRAGQGSAVTLTTSGWRDAAGALWRPNTLASVSIPRLGVVPATLCIGDVDYVRDETGTRTTLTLMPRETFLPEPLQLLPPRAGVEAGSNASPSPFDA